MKRDNIYTLLEKYKDEIKLSDETIPLNDSIEFLIKINISSKHETELREIIDLSIYLLKNLGTLRFQLDDNNKFKSYYLSKLIEKNILAFPKNIIDINLNLNIKLLNLINFYKRSTLEYKDSLYVLFFVIKNKNDIKKILKQNTNDPKEVLNKLKSNKYNNEYKSSDDKILHKDDICCYNNGNKFINILDINIARKLPIIPNKKYLPGRFSEVTFLELDDDNKLKINNELNSNIDNIIVKKKYLINSNPTDDDDYYLFHKFGGIEILFENEIKCLQCLFKLNHFPILLAADYDNLEIYMNYCGENLEEDNVPENWKEQIDLIITSLNELNIYNNDFWVNNLLVHKKILYMIDFGFSSFFEEDFPFININKDELSNATDLIMLLDNAMIRSIEKRLFNNF